MPRVSPVPTRLKTTPSKPKTKAAIDQPSVDKSRQTYLLEIGRGAEGGVGRFSVETDNPLVSSAACKGPHNSYSWIGKRGSWYHTKDRLSYFLLSAAQRIGFAEHSRRELRQRRRQLLLNYRATSGKTHLRVSGLAAVRWSRCWAVLLINASFILGGIFKDIRGIEHL